MKRIGISSLLLCTSLLFASKVAITIKVRGDVKLIPANTKTEKLLKPGTPLNDQDKILTSEKAFAAIMYLDDKTVVKVMGNSEMVIAGTRGKIGINKSIDIKYGKISANISSQGGKEFRIATPTSVASVKGTELSIVSDPVQGDSFVLLEGLIEVTNSITGETMEVNEGETAVSTPDGSLDVRETTEEDLDEFDEAEAAADGQIQELRFEVEDANGNIKEIIIQYQ